MHRKYLLCEWKLMNLEAAMSSALSFLRSAWYNHQFFGLRVPECVTFIIAKITKDLFSPLQYDTFFFCCSIFLLQPIPKQPLSHTHPSIVPITIFIQGLCILPPRCTAPREGTLQCRQYRIWPCVACPSHGPSHTVGYHLR